MLVDVAVESTSLLNSMMSMLISFSHSLVKFPMEGFWIGCLQIAWMFLLVFDVFFSCNFWNASNFSPFKASHEDVNSHICTCSG